MSDESSVFRALADDTRRDILRLLSSARRPVGDLAASFPSISRPAVSKHLRILREAGLVSESREGRHRLYRLRPETLDLIGGWLERLETQPVGGARGRDAASARPRRGSRPARRKPGLRPLRRDEPAGTDWRAW